MAEADFQIDTDALVNAGVNAAQDNPTVKSALAQVGGGAATGAALGAAVGSIVPGVGNIIGAEIGTIVGAVAGIVPTLLRVLHGQCTITIAGQDADCRDYPNNLKVAAQWVQDHPDLAGMMSPDALSVQAHILTQDFADWYATISGGYQSRIQSSGALDTLRRLPGAQSLLRVVQIPIASAFAASAPELMDAWRITFPLTFPALTPGDVDKIAAQVAPIVQKEIADAIAWSNGITPKPTQDQIHAHFPKLTPSEVARVFATPLTPGQQFVASGHGVTWSGPPSIQEIRDALSKLPASAWSSVDISSSVDQQNLRDAGLPTNWDPRNPWVAYLIDSARYQRLLKVWQADPTGAATARQTAHDAYAKFDILGTTLMNGQPPMTVDQFYGLPGAPPYTWTPPTPPPKPQPPTPPTTPFPGGSAMTDPTRVIPVAGSPTITPGGASGIVGAVPSDPNAALFTQDTIAAARAGNAIAAANAQLLTLASKISEQAAMATKWAGANAGARIATGAHLAVPANSPAARVPMLAPPAPAATTVVVATVAPVKPTSHAIVPAVAPRALARVAGRPSAWLRR